MAKSGKRKLVARYGGAVVQVFDETHGPQPGQQGAVTVKLARTPANEAFVRAVSCSDDLIDVLQDMRAVFGSDTIKSIAADWEEAAEMARVLARADAILNHIREGA